MLGVAEHLRWVWCGELLGHLGTVSAAAEHGGVPLAGAGRSSPEKQSPTCTCECKQGSALQVSYGFVFSTSGDSTLALTHQNLSQVAL